MPIGYFFGFKLGKSYGITQARKEYQKKIKTVFPQPETVNNISGKIISIEGNKIKLEGSLPIFNPLEPTPQIKQFTFSITDQTKILKRKLKTAEEMRTETKNADAQSRSILPYTETNISLNDLKTDTQIQVISKDNLLKTTESAAEEIAVVE